MNFHLFRWKREEFHCTFFFFISKFKTSHCIAIYFFRITAQFYETFSPPNLFTCKQQVNKFARLENFSERLSVTINLHFQTLYNLPFTFIRKFLFNANICPGGGRQFARAKLLTQINKIRNEDHFKRFPLGRNNSK